MEPTRCRPLGFGGSASTIELIEFVAVGVGSSLGVGQVLGDAGSEFVEPLGHLASRLACPPSRRWASLGSERTALCDGGEVGAVVGEHALEDIACFVEVV